MFSKVIIRVIRWILTLVLVYLAYTETGIWTGICLFLIMISIELLSYVITKAFEAIKECITTTKF